MERGLFLVGGAWRQWLIVVAGAAMILAAIAAVRLPSVFTDTDDYYALGKELAIDAGVTPPPELSDADVAQARIDAHMGHTQMASRSAVYGVFLYGLESAGTLWLVALAQALAVAWPVATLWRVALPGRRRAAALVALLVATLATPLPFFAGFAMPDVFAGLAPLAAALLLIYPDRIGTWERRGLAVLLVFSMAVHTSHILLMVVLALVSGVVLLALDVDRRQAWRRLGVLAAAIALAVLLNSLYGIGIRLNTGEPLRNQPFLTARVLADGPGRAYLRHACAAGERYTLCRFAKKPLTDSEDILWSDLPKTGVFMLSDYATRVRLEDQEGRFVLGTLAYAPFGQLAASLGNWARQLDLVFVDDPVRDPVFYLTDPYWSQTNLPPMLGRIDDCGPRHTGCRARLSVAWSKLLHGAGTVAALAAVAGVFAVRRRAAPPLPRRLVMAVAFLLAAVAVNAAVCGILSGPFARYQARIVWLVALSAVLLVAARRGAGGGKAAPAA